MNPPADSAAAARLCAQCGLCCNGVLFHTVQLQPGDSAKAIAALGLRLKRKQGRHFILQPCPAYCDSQCSIYAARPERCRLFECRQLTRLAAGEITEEMARGKIHQARQRVAQLNELLQQAGQTNLKHPLSRRCETILAGPPDPAAPPNAVARQHQLKQAMRELDALLNADFRIVPGVVFAVETAEAGRPGQPDAAGGAWAPCPQAEHGTSFQAVGPARMDRHPGAGRTQLDGGPPAKSAASAPAPIIS